jgi:hypothetical protein
MELTGEPHMAVTRDREGVSAGVCKVKENTPFGKYANAAWAEWAEWGAGGLRGVAGWRGRGWAEIRRKFLFEYKLNFGIYQHFGNLYKEI